MNRFEILGEISKQLQTAVFKLQLYGKPYATCRGRFVDNNGQMIRVRKFFGEDTHEAIDRFIEFITNERVFYNEDIRKFYKTNRDLTFVDITNEMHKHIFICESPEKRDAMICEAYKNIIDERTKTNNMMVEKGRMLFENPVTYYAPQCPSIDIIDLINTMRNLPQSRVFSFPSENKMLLSYCKDEMPEVGETPFDKIREASDKVLKKYEKVLNTAVLHDVDVDLGGLGIEQLENKELT